MATVTGLTAERMQEIIDATIVDADVVGDNLILTKDDGSTIDAGNVRGDAGIGKGAAFPAGATDGDLFVRTDQVKDPLYKYTDGAWVLAGGGLEKVTAFPAGATDGDVVVRTDLTGDPMYKFTDGVWELQPRMGGVNVPAVRATIAGGVQSFATTVSGVINLTSEDFDTDAMHDPVTNSSRITIKTPGIYQIEGYTETNISPTGNAPLVNIFKNGALLGPDPFVLGVGGATGRAKVSGTVRLAAGDYLELQFVNASNGTLTVTRAWLSAIWMGGAGQTVDERGVPGARAYNTAAVTGVNNVYTLMPFDNEHFDTDSIHDTVVNNTRLTIKTPGLYSVKARINFGANASGWRGLQILKNGGTAGTPYSQQPPVNGDNTTIECAATLLLAAGDYLELQYFQNSGGTLSVGGGSGGGTSLEVVMVGSGKTVTPFSRVSSSANQSIANTTATAIAFNGEDADNDAIHDTVTNNTRLTCRTAGVYHISGSVLWATGAGNYRQLKIQKNGATELISVSQPPVGGGNGTRQVVNATVELAVGDYVELIAQQDSGGALNVTTDVSTRFSMAKIGSPLVGGSGIGPAQADVFTVATLPAATTVPNGRIVGVSDAAAGQQARMSMNGAWINLG